MMQDVNRIPVATMADLESLDDAEILEGYHDGRDGFPCGENRSRSYWHGWRNGMVDSGRKETDSAGMKLAHEYLSAMSKSRSSPPKTKEKQ